MNGSSFRCPSLFIIIASLLGGAALPSAGRAQDNYEIQVYGSETVAPWHTMVELHSNFTAEGRRDFTDGLEPTAHAEHETVEITQGFTDWFETGFYIFTSARSGQGWQWVGDHIRPRVRVPPSWHWPVGASLSMEVGYQRRAYSPDTWTWEIRPIIDQQRGPWYWSLNPTFDLALRGENAARGYEFSPNVKVSYDVTHTVTLGVEYYGSLGPVLALDPTPQQEHQIFPSLDLNISPEWEINTGVGFGLTPTTDHLIFKLILGRRFALGSRHAGQ